LDQSSVLSFRSNYQNFLNLNAIIVRDFVSFYCLFNVRFGCASLLRWKQWWDQVAPLKCWKLLWIPCQHFSTPLPLCLPWQDPMHPFEPIFNGLAASYTEQKSVSVPWNVWPGTEESLDCVIPTCFFLSRYSTRYMKSIEVCLILKYLLFSSWFWICYKTATKMAKLQYQTSWGQAGKSCKSWQWKRV
jgi:hypothetical protein